MLRFLYLVGALALAIASSPSVASIALNTTRVIFADGQNEASFGVRNMGGDILIQSWLDDDSNSPSGISQHFTVAPQLARVRANSEQIVRILYEGVGAPSDKESMFWLNVQEIPQRPDTDEPSLQLAILQRIKVFYRPKGLAGELSEAVQNLEWRYQNQTLHIHNPSVYYVTLVGLSGNNKTLETALVVPPGETYTLTLPKQHSLSSQDSLSYAYVSDYGAHIPYRVQLTGEQPAKGERAR